MTINQSSSYYKYYKVKVITSIIILLTMLSACSGDQCIDADDFGHVAFEVPSRYSKEELEGQVEDTQVAPWIDSEYRVNGRPLAISVKGWDNGIETNKSYDVSAWCAWFGTKENKSTLNSICARLIECEFIDGEMCTDTVDANIVNAPCLFKKGVGLYALIAEKNQDPNITLASRKKPLGITYHLGSKKEEYGMYEIDKKGNTREAGGRVYIFDNESMQTQYNDSKLYFKILDKYYDDNSGQYKVLIKSGISRTNPDPFTYATKLVKDFMYGEVNDGGIVKDIYLGIINNAGFRMSVAALLTLYVIYTGLIYLIGSIELTNIELITRVSKIAIISALLSTEYSWTFFYDYLFVYFMAGVEQILNIITEAGASGPGAPGIFALLIAPQTIAKVLSLLFVDWLGFIYIGAFFVILLVVLFVFFQATVIYLTSIMAISMIIIMGPIFICFLLFDFTKSLFENWLKQLISYSFQPIILFTGLVFISMIIRHELYGSLGFRVCKQNFLYMSGDGVGELAGKLFDSKTSEAMDGLTNSIFYWWFPQPMIGSEFTRETKMIPIPEDHFTDTPVFITNNFTSPVINDAVTYNIKQQNTENYFADINNMQPSILRAASSSIVSDGNNMFGEFCQAYHCIGERYVDLPFLDPVKDQRRINAFWNGNFVQLDGMLVIIIALYLLFKFNGLAVNISNFITGTSGNLTNTQKIADIAARDLGNSMKSFANGLAKGAKGTASGAAGAVARASGGMRKVLESVGGKAGFDGTRTSSFIKALGSVEQKSLKAKHFVDHGAKESILAARKAVIDEISPSALVDKAMIKNAKNSALSPSAKSSVLNEVSRNTGLDRSNLDKNAVNNYKKALSDALYNNSDKNLPDVVRRKAADRAAKILASEKYSDQAKKLAQMKYGKNYSELSKVERKKIDTVFDGNKIKKLANKVIELKVFEEEYAKAYFGMSNKGIGVVGKNVRLVRSAEKIKDRSNKIKHNKREKDRLLGEKLLGNKSGHKIIDARNNNRKLNHEEIYKERQAKNDEDGINLEIDRLNHKYRENITTPEFLAKAKLAKDKDIEKLNAYANTKVIMDFDNKLKNSSNVALYGDNYLKHNAKDSKMRASMEQIRASEQQFIASDRFISKENEYIIEKNKASMQIENNKEMLQKHFKTTEIKNSEVKSLLNDYAKDKDFTDEKRDKMLDQHEKSLRNERINSQTLEQIDQRKETVKKRAQQHIDKINKYRSKAGMDEYNPD